MSLKVELKPGEKLLIGSCVITNADQRTRLFIDGSAPILREKDILTAESADTPAKRIYLAVQLMYINDDVSGLTAEYFQLVNDIVRAAPSTVRFVDEIKAAKKLIGYERDLLANASTGGGGLSDGR